MRTTDKPMVRDQLRRLCDKYGMTMDDLLEILQAQIAKEPATSGYRRQELPK